jgi:hypothetical protein
MNSSAHVKWVCDRLEVVLEACSGALMALEAVCARSPDTEEEIRDVQDETARAISIVRDLIFELCGGKEASKGALGSGFVLGAPRRLVRGANQLRPRRTA